MYAWLMRPSNLVCDLLHMSDDHERGMMRMLINIMLLGLAAAAALMAAWAALVR